MILLSVCLLVAFIFAATGFLVWLCLWLFKIRSLGWRVFKATALSLLLFLPLFVFLLAPLIFSYLVAHASTRPQDQKLPDTPARYGRPFREVEFPSRDGLRLKGWWMEGEPHQPALIFCHGLFRNRQEMLQRACSFNRLGYPALLFDFRNHAKSDRQQVSLGFYERLDVLGAHHFVKNSVGKSEMAFLGVSMGAVAVLQAAGEFGKEVRWIVADSPFLSLEDTVRRHTRLVLNLPPFPFATVFIWNFTRLSRFRKEDLDTVRAAAKIPDIPVLLIYGTADRRTPPDSAQALLEAISSPHKKLFLAQGSTHGAAYRSAPEEYLQTILEFGAASVRERVPCSP